MNLKTVEIVKVEFGLSTLEYEAVIRDKSNTSRFALYMTVIDFVDNAKHIFTNHNITVHTTFDSIRGYTSLYQLLLKPDFDMRNDRRLFLFICNSLCLTRELKPGELL